MKKLTRSKDRKISGVCGGIAEYLNIDPIIIRIIFLFLIFFGGSGLILYLILLIIMPNKEEEYTPYSDVTNESEGASSTENDAEDNNEASINDTKEDVANKIKKGTSSYLVLGIILILFGIFVLCRNILPFFDFDFYFPVLIIIFGITLIIISFNKKHTK